MSQIKVLFFAADPASADRDNPDPRLLLDEDVRRIREKVRAAEHRDAIDFDHRWAARPDDLIQALNEVSPQIVHFSGHGGRQGLVLVGEDGYPQTVPAAALTRLFTAFRGGIRLAVLNACTTLPLAEALAPVIGCAIGNRGKVPDDAAVLFGAAFYRAIAFGKSVQAAYDQACVAMSIEGFTDDQIPVLVTGPGVDPSSMVLVRPVPTGPVRPTHPDVHQNVTVGGNGNNVNVAGRDMHLPASTR